MEIEERHWLTNFKFQKVYYLPGFERMSWKSEESSIQTHIAALKLHIDDVYDRLDSDQNNMSSYIKHQHQNCYTEWSIKENMRYKQHHQRHCQMYQA